MKREKIEETLTIFDKDDNVIGHTSFEPSMRIAFNTEVKNVVEKWAQENGIDEEGLTWDLGHIKQSVNILVDMEKDNEDE